MPELPASADVPPELDDPEDDDDVDDDVDPDDELVFAVSDPPDDDVDDVDGGGVVCDFCDVGSDDGDDDSLEQANAKIAIAAGHRNTYVFIRRTLGR